MGLVTLSFVIASPLPANGYLIKYKSASDVSYTTVVPNVTTSPISIPVPTNTEDYSGTIQADCGGGLLSAAAEFIAPTTIV